MHTIRKAPGLPIILITLTEPFDFRKEPPMMMEEIHQALGAITGPFWTIYDIRSLTFTVSKIVDGVATIAHPRSTIAKEIEQYGRLALIGKGTFANLAAKTANRFSPGKSYQVFSTPEEAIAYARVHLADTSLSQTS